MCRLLNKSVQCYNCQPNWSHRFVSCQLIASASISRKEEKIAVIIFGKYLEVINMYSRLKSQKVYLKFLEVNRLRLGRGCLRNSAWRDILVKVKGGRLTSRDGALEGNFRVKLTNIFFRVFYWVFSGSKTLPSLDHLTHL